MVPEVGRPLFRQKLPLAMLEGFRRVLDNGRDDSYVVDVRNHAGYFRGKPTNYGVGSSEERKSFVHMAAYTGQDEYVLREVSMYPKLYLHFCQLSFHQAGKWVHGKVSSNAALIYSYPVLITLNFLAFLGWKAPK